MSRRGEAPSRFCKLSCTLSQRNPANDTTVRGADVNCKKVTSAVKSPTSNVFKFNVVVNVVCVAAVISNASGHGVITPYHEVHTGVNMCEHRSEYMT